MFFRRYDFKFSIITCFYNMENFLEECIESVINQSIGFEDNVQLILVDDGSTDNSMQIAKSYGEKYPNNILILSQNHSGIPYARNLGLKHVKGEYVNFLDSDDYISSNALEDIYEFFENDSETDIATLSVNYIDRIRKSDDIHSMFNETTILDLEMFPNIPLSIFSSVFIKYELIKDYFFDDNLICGEDLLLLNKLLLNQKKYAIIPSSQYYCRKRYDLTNILDKVIFDDAFYIPRIKNFHIGFVKECLERYGVIPKFIQYSLIFDLLNILKESELLLSENKYGFFLCLNEFLQYIDDDIIFENEFIEEELKYFILYLKYGDIDYKIQEFNVISEIDKYTLDKLNIHKFWYDKVEIDENFLYISAILNSYFDNDDISIVAVKEKNGEYELFKGAFLENDNHKNKRYMSVDWNYVYPFDIKIPIDDLRDSKIRIRVNYHKIDFYNDPLSVTPTEFAQQLNYPAILGANESALNTIYGYCESVNAYDTYQFTDYSQYNCDVFDETHKAQMRNTQFPKDLEKAFDLGKRLVEMSK